jgi:UDP-glucuronate 4-epimerase
MHKIYITGIAGFIGFHLAEKLAMEGYEVGGMDNFNDYYDPQLKRDRALLLKAKFDMPIYEANIETVNWNKLWKNINWESLGDYDAVIHLAAHAGVRHSLENPQMYIDTNISATQKLIKACEEHELPVIYASSSCVDSDLLNPYAWSKFVNELQFKSSSLLSAGLRFFTVYGEYGRPDMALSLFAEAMSQGKAINIYNHGDMQRDFTYVGDLVKGIHIILENMLNQPQENRHELYNLGTGKSNELMDYIECLENQLGRVSLKNYLPMHPADVKSTQADITKAQALGYNPTTTIYEGIKHFADWFKSMYI